MSSPTAQLPRSFVSGSPNQERLVFARKMREDFLRLQMEHQFGIDEVLTKVSILQREFLHLHQYNPIEHVGSRIKSTASILEKALRRDLEMTTESIRAGITDIAGIRITCSFISDTYRVLETLTSQSDVQVLKIKDYIKCPKPNGYQSLHAIIQIPVFLTSGPVPVTVEVQIRTIAMDFWASLEHKIHYKYNGSVPDHLAASLTQTADIAGQLDRRMEQMHQEVRGINPQLEDDSHAIEGVDEALLLQMWERAQPLPEAVRESA
ncbi:GTP pyrophosphokinase family protein [Leucobacter sp. cx-169]|uniref:GTP pyrophosphokinase n=1 Tax=unclassified Leucobacter TaxID=2621730 RepID=UPI00165E6272|nr:GTP pyrophosphokinase family protein [Leucobacter sp. cx-169]